MADIDSLTRAAGDPDPGTGLKAAAALRRLAEFMEGAQVRQARRLGWSWQDIAEVLGVSRQAVHKKYAALEKQDGDSHV